MKIYIRMMIPLLPGEEQPTYALQDPPEGYRWETDAELRERIKKDLESSS